MNKVKVVSSNIILKANYFPTYFLDNLKFIGHILGNILLYQNPVIGPDSKNPYPAIIANLLKSI